MVTPQPPGNDWLCRTGHGFQTSKRRKAAKTPRVASQWSFEKKNPGAGNVPVLAVSSTVQPAKQRGIAAISSQTTDPGSLQPRIFSPAPQSHTDRASPRTIPP